MPIVVLALAACLYMVLAFLHPIGGYGVETDFYGSYAVEALRLLQGGDYQETEHGPGYSVALIPFYLVLRDMFWAGKVLTVMSAVALVFISYRLFSESFSRNSAIVSSIFLVIVLTPYAYLASNDVFFAVIALFSIYLVHRSGSITSRGLLFSGLVAGYAFMTRMNAIVILLYIVTLLVIVNPERWNLQRRLRGVAIFTAAFLIAAAPWLIMNYLNRGNPLATDVYQTVGAGMGREASIAWAEEKRVVAQQYDSVIDVVLADPGRTATVFVKNVIGHFQSLFYRPELFPVSLLVVPGLLLILATSEKRQLSLFLFPLFGFLIYGLLPFMSRFFIYVFPFLMLPAARALLWWEALPAMESRFNVRKSFWVNATAFAFTLAILSLNVARMTKKQLRSDPVDLLSASQELRKKGYEGMRIIARKPHLGFTSGMDVVYFPRVDGFDQLLNYAKDQEAELLLYSPIEADLRSKFRDLQYPGRVAQWFRLVYEDRDAGLWVYQVNHDGAAVGSN